MVVTLWLLAWIIGTAMGLTVPAFDATSAMAYLTPLLTLYFGRRWTSDSKGGWKGSGGPEEGETEPLASGEEAK